MGYKPRSDIRKRITNQILQERKRQGISRDETSINDMQITIGEWTSAYLEYLAKASAMTTTPFERRENLIKLAAMVVAQIESIDNKIL